MRWNDEDTAIRLEYALVWVILCLLATCVAVAVAQQLDRAAERSRPVEARSSP